MDYAQNQYNVEIKKQILNLMEIYSSPEKNQTAFEPEHEHEHNIMSLWFLLDGVMLAPGDLAQLAKAAKHSKDLLGQTKYTIDDEDFGPWLMQAPDENAPQDTWLTNLIAACNGLPALSIIVTEHPADDIVATLANLITVNTTDKQSFYCRFADTRVIPVLTKVLSEEQTNTALTTIKHWYYVNRIGNLEAAIHREHEANTRVFYSPMSLLLNEQQFADMLETSEPDNIFGLLCEVSADLVPEEARGIFHKRLEHILELTQLKSINDIPDQLQFIILALSYGEDFHELNILQDTWHKIRNQTAKFGQLMADWPDEIWQCLEESKVSA